MLADENILNWDKKEKSQNQSGSCRNRNIIMCLDGINDSRKRVFFLCTFLFLFYSRAQFFPVLLLAGAVSCFLFRIVHYKSRNESFIQHMFMTSDI